MKNNLLFDFTVDKSNNTIKVKKAFDAEPSLVWDAFTKKEILDKWWAPKPWLSKTKRMDFIVGGRRFYAMVSPEGQEYWSIQEYKSITPETNFKYFDAFSDKDENISTALPTAEWDFTFNGQLETTTVEVTIQHKTLADIEQIIQMGFKEGFIMALTELEKLLNNH
jgi:uncharacterized protein YndB with AHSA1/START domain